jgi:HTH-type transcriptional regulator / antitoxin HigA
MTATMTAAYQALQARFTLRPIRSARQRQAAEEALLPLAMRNEKDLSADERDYLDVLSNLIEKYDQEHHPMPRRKGTIPQRLAALMEFGGVTASDLRTILGLSQPQVSLILSGKRGLSKTSATRLAEHFKLSLDYFH